MMLFGVDWSRSQPTRRSGLLGGNLRGVALAGAGMLALRWWRNRRVASASRAPAEREPRRNPVDGWQ